MVRRQRKDGNAAKAESLRRELGAGVFDALSDRRRAALLDRFAVVMAWRALRPRLRWGQVTPALLGLAVGYNGVSGRSLAERTLRRWIAAYTAGGARLLLDHRGRPSGRPRGRPRRNGAGE